MSVASLLVGVEGAARLPNRRRNVLAFIPSYHEQHLCWPSPCDRWRTASLWRRSVARLALWSRRFVNAPTGSPFDGIMLRTPSYAHIGVAGVSVGPSVRVIWTGKADWFRRIHCTPHGGGNGMVLATPRCQILDWRTMVECERHPRLWQDYVRVGEPCFASGDHNAWSRRTD